MLCQRRVFDLQWVGHEPRKRFFALKGSISGIRVVYSLEQCLVAKWSGHRCYS